MVVWVFITSNSSGVSFPGLSKCGLEFYFANVMERTGLIDSIAILFIDFLGILFLS
jgi:hypothetical protein